MFATDRLGMDDDIFRWSDGFKIGVREIDEQHERLVALLNRLARHHTTKAPGEDLYRVFDELVSYATYHFATEERVMREAGVSEQHAELHRRAHQEFATKVVAARRSAETSSPDVTGDALIFVTNWLIHHILGVDRRLGEEVREAERRTGLRFSTDLPPTSARTTDVLLNAIDGLYERLGHNIAELRETNRLLQAELAKSQKNELDLRIAATAFEAQETIIICDARIRILRVNKAFAVTTGYESDEVVGKNPRLLSSGRQLPVTVPWPRVAIPG